MEILLCKFVIPKRYSWSGAALPGGHIEEHEGLVESVIREVKEETGLTIHHPQLVGMKHWYTKEDVRYLVFLYRTSDFEGDLQSSAGRTSALGSKKRVGTA